MTEMMLDDKTKMVRLFAGLLTPIARRGVRCGLWHHTLAVRGVGRDCFGVERGELVTVRHRQIWVRPSRRLVDTTRVGLWGGGEGVGLMRGPALPVVGGMCPSRAVGFSSFLLAFFPRWSDRTDGCSGVDGRGFAGVVVWLGDVWWADLAFTSPVVGVFIRDWDRGLLRLSPMV
ncbi:hypothetical protein TIFTF001_014240 [Ficus carica]|uniref:Uncharacterized protein n=1 Tax=Ficus carica TaxID=3494 RepID=A0AA88D6U2_FICCA|nr:hypothetical protein TIFTF001_014240 [Ficus carica]